MYPRSIGDSEVFKSSLTFEPGVHLDRFSAKGALYAKAEGITLLRDSCADTVWPYRPFSSRVHHPFAEHLLRGQELLQSRQVCAGCGAISAGDSTQAASKPRAQETFVVNFQRPSRVPERADQ